MWTLTTQKNAADKAKAISTNFFLVDAYLMLRDNIFLAHVLLSHERFRLMQGHSFRAWSSCDINM